MIEPGLIDPEVAADLIDAANAAAFSDRLLAMAHSLAGVDEVFAYQVGDSGSPKVLASSSGLARVSDRTSWYTRRFHHSDPANLARLQAPPGTGFARRVPAEEIAQADYRRICFERPHFNEKLCYGWRGPAHSLVLSFYSRQSAPSPPRALDALAQVALAGLARNIRSRDVPLAPVLESRLSAAFPALTVRECEVTARTMAGDTAQKIGADLGISVGTVLTYRQRTYQKLGVSRASDLLGEVIH